MSAGERQPDVLQQLQRCCPTVVLPGCSPTAMLHMPPQSVLPHGECTPPGWHHQGPCPTLYCGAFSVPSVSLWHPCCLARLLAALGTRRRVSGGESGDAPGKTTLGCKLGQGTQAATPQHPSMIWGTGAPQGPALCPGLSVGGTTGSTHPSTLAASTQPSGHPDYPPPLAAGLVRPQHGGEGGGGVPVCRA